MANALIIDIPFQAIDSIELFVNKFRYSVAQVAAQAQAKRPEHKGVCGYRRDVEHNKTF